MAVEDGQGQGGNTGGDSGQGQQSGQSGQAQQPAAGQNTPPNTGTGQQGQQSGQSQVPPTGANAGKFTYEEDRGRWIPPHRLQEETTKRQGLESQLAEANRRVRALSGVEDDPNASGKQKAQAKEAREALLEVMPELKDLLDSKDALQSSVKQQWTNHGATMLGGLSERVSDAIGGDLSDRQRARLNDSFITFLQRDIERAEREGTESVLLRRYNAGDQKLLDDFAKEFAEDWFEPARRKATAGIADRANRRVPNSRPGSPVVTSGQKPVFKTLDERMDFAVKAAKERGMRFGRDDE